MAITFYEVGGHVRDSFLGLTSKDIDYAVEAPSYDAMIEAVKGRGYEIKVQNPKFVTVTAKGPLGVADFTLCRKDGEYHDGRHPSDVIPGSLLEDLTRRDFTVNAIARTEDGKIIDPHGGIRDIEWRLLRCVGKTETRFSEDGLRMLRALRFAVTRSFILDGAIIDCLRCRSFFEPRMKGVSAERVREELGRMFRFSTSASLDLFDHFADFRAFLFRGTVVWLKPTMEAR